MGYEKHYGEEMSAERVQQVTMSKVYGWMTLALMASALAAIYTAGSETMLGLIFGSKIGFLGLMVAEVALVVYVSARLMRLSFGTAATLFGLYAVLNGITMSAILLAYSASTVYAAFFSTGLTFGVMSFVGYTTDRDLTGIGSFLMMALVGLIIGTLCTKTSYGGLHQMIFGVIQSNLMRFMGNNIGAWAFFNIMTGLLWFFGLHGGNIVGSITNPIYTPLSLENLEVYMADPTAKLPNIISGAFGKTFTFGGVASMFGLAILMVFFAKSEQMKTLGKLALPTTIFFINEPLLFGIPCVLNPLFFFPMLFLTTIQGVLTYIMMKIGVVPIARGVQIPWTTPPVIDGFLQGGVGLAIWEFLMVLLSMVLWYPFFKIQDNISLKQEQGDK